MITNNKIDTKVKILLAAKTEFSLKGFAGARTEDIAKNAGINKAMLHYYFGNKEKLYHTILHAVFHIQGRRLQKIFNQVELPSAKYKLRFLLEFMGRYNHDCIDPEFHKIISWELAEGRQKFSILVNEYFLPRVKGITKLIEEGIKQGEFSTSSPMLYVMHIISFFNMYAIHRQVCIGTELFDALYGSMDFKDFLSYTLNHFFKAITKEGEPVTVPKLPKNLQEELDEVINYYRKNKNNQQQIFHEALEEMENSRGKL